MRKVKNLKLKISLVGESVPNKTNGMAGRYIENLIEDKGIPINREATIDTPLFEVKSRDLDAVSAHTIGGMKLDDIKITSWEDSPIFKKFQQQYRVKTKDNIVVSNEIYDFSGWAAQDLLKEAYNECRKKIINGDVNNYIYGTKYGYFEKTNKNSNVWCFRIRDNSMKKLEKIAQSTINDIFYN